MTYIYERKQTTDLYQDLKRMGRDNFSYYGAKVLMEYLEQIAEDTGEAIEYDPIAFCCDFAEYSNDEMHDLSLEYDDAPHVKDYSDEEDWKSAFIEWLNEQTQVIEHDNGFIIQAF